MISFTVRVTTPLKSISSLVSAIPLQKSIINPPLSLNYVGLLLLR
jgi:hypothetical protein